MQLDYGPIRSRFCAYAILALQAPIAANAWARDFLIEEVTEYPAPCTKDCHLNTCTSSLYDAMIADSWEGTRFSNGMAWPQDFWDPNRATGGMDNWQADANQVVVFAGHSGAGEIHFAPHEGATSASTFHNMRLSGASDSAGGKAGLAVWLSCRFLAVDVTGDERSVNNLRQQLGFLNIIGIYDNEPRSVYFKTKTQENKDAWLSTMGGPGGEDFVTREAENRKPIVVTKVIADQESTCWSFHDNLSWAQDVMETMPGHARYTCWEWLD